MTTYLSAEQQRAVRMSATPAEHEYKYIDATLPLAFLLAYEHDEKVLHELMSLGADSDDVTEVRQWCGKYRSDAAELTPEDVEIYKHPDIVGEMCGRLEAWCARQTIRIVLADDFRRRKFRHSPSAAEQFSAPKIQPPSRHFRRRKFKKKANCAESHPYPLSISLCLPMTRRSLYMTWCCRRCIDNRLYAAGAA
jgi:hypothetical protein